MMKEMLSNSYLYGGNATFVEALYESYLENPASVSAEWQAYFTQLANAQGGMPDIAHGPIQRAFLQRAQAHDVVLSPGHIEALAECDRKQVYVLQLINAHRFQGMRQANLDPLKRMEHPYIPELDPAYYGLSEADMETAFETGSLVGATKASLREILQIVKQTYCGTIGSEYMYISDTAQKRWVQDHIEGCRATPTTSVEQKLRILERLVAAKTLERYLHTRYVGQKRFSLEGSLSLIPLLDHLVQESANQGVQEMVIGMAHRGRLNVLVNILGKSPAELFQEFEGKHNGVLLSGDVKYHQGFSGDVASRDGSIHVTLAFNPSHLEIVNPVVEGSVRARQQRRADKQGKQVIPVLIHGDAAFAGQGVVMETLNMSQTRGFGTGGTVHIVINNQIGFTTSDPRDTRSSLHCTDVAKMVAAPVFHVNGDDPEAVLLVTKIALDYRTTFQKDVVIDLVCFRRHGHNEQDEPFVTQPLMYKKISQHPGTLPLYSERLQAQNIIPQSHIDELVQAYRVKLEARDIAPKPVSNFKRAFATDWSPFKTADWRTEAVTALPLEDLARLAHKLTMIPEGFILHSRVEKIICDRRAMGEGNLPLDWGMAETLAYAGLLEADFGVRISGQDSGRGTFFHRHAVLHDQNRERWDAGVYVPLQNLSETQANFIVVDSLLSEEAVLGFEYGYSTAEPNQLVVWEAQFGDFANGAQVVIDQFIASGEAKWGKMCALVMMLPHGYEGQGPEHSSARMERYLQLCADNNMQVCQPTTPAQMFHLLRRQMLRPYRKPLIIMSPKSLLRHKDSVSPLAQFASGMFEPVLGEIDAIHPKQARRVVICSGRLYFDLLAARRERAIKDIAILRIEQFYPFPHDEFAKQLAPYTKAKELMWAQDEPQNQGAWYQIQHHLREYVSTRQTLRYAGRNASASPASGYLSQHKEQLKAIVDEALN